MYRMFNRPLLTPAIPDQYQVGVRSLNAIISRINKQPECAITRLNRSNLTKMRTAVRKPKCLGGVGSNYVSYQVGAVVACIHHVHQNGWQAGRGSRVRISVESMVAVPRRQVQIILTHHNITITVVRKQPAAVRRQQ